jgi:hypothetical protein
MWGTYILDIVVEVMLLDLRVVDQKLLGINDLHCNGPSFVDAIAIQVTLESNQLWLWDVVLVVSHEYWEDESNEVFANPLQTKLSVDVHLWWEHCDIWMWMIPSDYISG